MNDETRKYLWNVESDLLTEVAFSLLIKETEERNKELYEQGKDVRAAYTTLREFIKMLPVNTTYQKYVKEAKFFIRKDKIDKIINHG